MIQTSDGDKSVEYITWKTSHLIICSMRTDCHAVKSVNSLDKDSPPNASINASFRNSLRILFKHQKDIIEVEISKTIQDFHYQ